MSAVIVGRLLRLTWMVIRPASSFETTTLVMSGAAGFAGRVRVRHRVLEVPRRIAECDRRHRSECDP
jgi:hypothetical protein